VVLRRSLLLALCAACAPGPGGDDAPSARAQRQALVTNELAVAPAQGGVPWEDTYNPAAGWLGSNFIVVFDDGHDGISRLAATRVTPNGVTLDDPPHVLRLSTDSARAPSIACNQTSCLVAWTEDVLNYAFGLDNRVVFVRVGPLAIPLDAPAIVDGGTAVQVATDGLGFAMTWSVSDGMGHQTVLIGRLDANGVLLDPQGIPVSATDSRMGGIAFVGDRYVVSYLDGTGHTPMAAMLELDGGLGPAVALPLPAQEGCYDTAIAAGGGTALVAADCYGTLWSDVFVARWAPDAGFLDVPAKQVTTSGGLLADTFNISAIAAPQGYWLGWSYDTGHPLASAGRVALDATPIDTAPLTLSPATGNFSYDTRLAVSPSGEVIAIWDEEPNGSNVGLSRM
jgi:hypothetical protein